MLKSHPLSLRTTLRIDDLVGQRLVLLERDSSFFATGFHALCTQVGIDLRRSQVVEAVPAQLYLVEAGLGVAVVPCSPARRVTGLVPRPSGGTSLCTAGYAFVRTDTPKEALWTFFELASHSNKNREKSG